MAKSFVAPSHLLTYPNQQGAKTTLRAAILPYIFSILVYALLFTFWQVEPVPWHVHLLSIVIVATGFVPLATWNAGRRERLPIFELLCLAYVLQFSMPIYTQPNGMVVFSLFVPFTWDALYAVLLIVELGLLALIIGYYWGSASLVVKLFPQIDLPLTRKQRNNYLLFAITLGGSMTLASLIGITFLQSAAIGAIIRLLSNQLFVGIVLFAYYLFTKEYRRQSAQIIFYAIVGSTFVLGLATGLLENALVPLVLVFIVYWHVTRRIPWRMVFIGILLFLVLNFAKHQYRALVWYGDSNYTLEEKIALWSNLATENFVNFLSVENWKSNERAVRETLFRFDLIHKFTHVYLMTPKTVPYYQGKTYSYFVSAWIPRVFWPNKPTATQWANQMDWDYRLRPVNSSYSIGVGQLPEAYANFGGIGVVVIMFLQGIVFAIFNHSLNSPQSQGGRAIYLTQMVFFFNGIGSTSAVLFGALLQQTLASAVIMRFFIDGFRSEQTTPKESTRTIAKA